MKQLLLFSILIALKFNVLSQNAPTNVRNKSNLEARMKVRKIAFLSERLQLTPEEAQVFFPLFNEYTAKIQVIREQGKIEKQVKDLTEAEAEKATAAQFDVEARLLDLKKEYYQKFKKVLSAKRLALLYEAQREFKEALLNGSFQNRQSGQLRQPRFAPNRQ